jgi:hypothetical protein
LVANGAHAAELSKKEEDVAGEQRLHFVIESQVTMEKVLLTYLLTPWL